MLGVTTLLARHIAMVVRVGRLLEVVRVGGHEGPVEAKTGRS